MDTILPHTCTSATVEIARDQLLTAARRFGQLQQHEARRILANHHWLPSKIDDIPAAMLDVLDCCEALVVAEAGAQS